MTWSSRLALFAYASLVSTASAGETVGRTAGASVPARLNGFSRAWTLGRDNIGRKRPSPDRTARCPASAWASTSSPPSASPAPNGALVEVAQAEFDRPRSRRDALRRLDVTRTRSFGRWIRDLFDVVFAYTARAEHHHPTPPDNAIVIGNYLHHRGRVLQLGPDQLDLFHATTITPPVGGHRIRDPRAGPKSRGQSEGLVAAIAGHSLPHSKRRCRVAAKESSPKRNL